MAASGVLAPFLSTMLGLRAQRLQEEEIKARMAQQQQEELMKGMQAAGSAFTGAMKDFRADQSANELAQRYFGGGPIQKTGEGQSFVGTPTVGGLMAADASKGRFTGGVEGLKQLMELEKMKRGDAGDIWKALNYDLARQANTRAQAAETRAASKASYNGQLYEKLEPAAKGIFEASKYYGNQSQASLEGMQKAMAADDPEAYRTHANELIALNDLHRGKKLSRALVDVPPYVGAKQAKEYADLMEGGRGPEDLSAAGKSSPLPPFGQMTAPPSQLVPAELVNRAQQGQPVSQAEAQSIVGPPPGGPQPGGGAPAPGAGAPLARRNPTTGQVSVFNHQTGKWEIQQ